MSKITNDGGLTQSGTGCFVPVVLYPYDNSGRQRVNIAQVNTHGLPRWYNKNRFPKNQKKRTKMPLTVRIIRTILNQTDPHNIVDPLARL